MGNRLFYSSICSIGVHKACLLTPMKNSDDYTYEFESESYLYFKVSDEANTLVKVPVVFRGNYSFQMQKGTYSFKLLKYSE